MKYDAIIIGGGISGLTAAWKLKTKGADVLLLEEKEYAGGHIRTVAHEGFRMESGPHSFLGSNEYTWSLVEELDFNNAVEKASPVSNNRYIYRDGRLHPLPLGLIQFLRTPLLSSKAKCRLALEPLIPGNAGDHDTAWEYFIRRFGEEAATYIMAPFISGVYAGNAKMLGARAAFPKFFNFEKESGSMILGAAKYMIKKRRRLKKEGKKRRKGMFSFEGGLGRITARLQEALGQRVLLNSPAGGIQKINDGFEITAGGKTFAARSVISAIPPNKAAPLIGGLLPEAGRTLESLLMAPVTLIHWSQREEGDDFPKGFGFLMPRIYEWRVLGTLFPSQLFSKRAENGAQLFASFYGGMLDKDALNLKDDEQLQILRKEHRAIFNRKIEEPGICKIIRYRHAIPQLLPDHPEKIDSIRKGLKKYPGLFLAGNYLTGVGMEHAVMSGYTAAEECALFLSGPDKI